MCRLGCNYGTPVSYMISPQHWLAVSVEVGVGLGWAGVCRAVTCCWLYAPLRAIEADVRNAPDILDLNVRYPVESSAGMGKGVEREPGCCNRRQVDAAEDSLDLGKRDAN